MEIRELLTSYDFPGDTIPIIKGSALAALEGSQVFVQRSFVRMSMFDCLWWGVVQMFRIYILGLSFSCRIFKVFQYIQCINFFMSDIRKKIMLHFQMIYNNKSYIHL